MSPRDLDDELAAAYVLGTLSAAGRHDVQARLPTDAALRAAVDGWEARLLPLTALAEPVEPSPALWARIENAIAPAVAPAAAPVRRRAPVQASAWQTWWSSLGFWRTVAATGFVAASVVALLPATGLFAPAAPQYMVVLVEPNGTAPGWIVQTSGTNTLRLVPLGTTAVPEQRSLQFWTKADTWNAPVSLGLVQPGQPLEVKLDQLPPLVPNQLFEITLEPYNGSPTGRPTGPILYIGRSVKLT
ncbi:MAG: anti-sigma factor [Hydrogenophaga sp.]|jgi:anti-sigma-K factor RskA|uniref:anti-sigma factor n=1 Tax=Hydrogenophaga sp. TaxID=1904254 RepID=UPI001D7E548A|nr:anti-sigma factor [Hydrogenophaga sp.]MBW0169085.1 anti-sigma factor [Hydrogenophaga sp.]MBW0183456.1 anti-sigma factor [Hydrogenophaga sp.]